MSAVHAAGTVPWDSLALHAASPTLRRVGYSYRARYYHPGLQRFIVEDPLRPVEERQSLYLYAGNQPIVRVDPFGLWAIAVGFGGEGGWGKGGSVVCYAIFGSGGYVPGCSFGFGGYTPGLFGGLYFAWFPKVPNTRALCGWGASTSFGYGPIQGGIGATKGHLGVGGAIDTPRGPLPYGYSGQVTYTGCGRKEFSEPPDFSAMP